MLNFCKERLLRPAFQELLDQVEDAPPNQAGPVDPGETQGTAWGPLLLSPDDFSGALELGHQAEGVLVRQHREHLGHVLAEQELQVDHHTAQEPEGRDLSAEEDQLREGLPPGIRSGNQGGLRVAGAV